jgi:hypothetical protein
MGSSPDFNLEAHRIDAGVCFGQSEPGIGNGRSRWIDGEVDFDLTTAGTYCPVGDTNGPTY